MLVVPKGCHGIHARRATGWHITSHKRDRYPENSDDDVHSRAPRSNAGLHRGERARRRDCQDFTDDDAGNRDRQTMQQHIAKNRVTPGS